MLESERGRTFVRAAARLSRKTLEPPTGVAMTQSDEHTEVEGPTAQDVSARVGEILGAAEREAREILAAARGEESDTGRTSESTTLQDLARALERLSLRFDAFELFTAARIEELGRTAAGGTVPAPAVEGTPPPPQFDPMLVAAAAAPEREDTPELAAARVRAIDLALAGYTRDSIANELAVSIERAEVDALLNRVLVA
jgi:hypothetical protein